jgi:hypothetical protein
VTERIASCQCGQLGLTARGEPLRVAICHCEACQRRSGSAFTWQARFPADRVEIRGDAREFVRHADETGEERRFAFCPGCGTTVYYRSDSWPDLIGVAVGTFADPDFPAPGFSVWERRRHEWVGLPDGVDRRA